VDLEDELFEVMQDWEDAMGGGEENNYNPYEYDEACGIMEGGASPAPGEFKVTAVLGGGAPK
jgi:hypothetical protein